MHRSIKVLTVLMLLVSTVFWTAQPTLAQTDHSHSRILGLGAMGTIGSFLPLAFNARLWIGHTLGLDGTLGFTLSPTASVFGIAGGLLLKFIDTPLIDLYFAGRVGLLHMQMQILPPPFPTIAMSLVSVVGGLGLELSFIRLLALSLELGLGGVGVAEVPGIAEVPGTTAIVGGFALTFAWVVHIYF